MKKLVAIISLLFSIASFSQEIEKVKGQYYIEGRQISQRHTQDLLASNTEALALFKSGKNKEAFGGLFVGFGAALISTDLIVGLFSDVSYPTAATYVGIASIAVSIPILYRKNKKLKDAIALYNNGLKDSGSNDSNIELNVISNQNGYGLQFRF